MIKSPIANPNPFLKAHHFPRALSITIFTSFLYLSISSTAPSVESPSITIISSTNSGISGKTYFILEASSSIGMMTGLIIYSYQNINTLS